MGEIIFFPVGEADPAHGDFPQLQWPPFLVDMPRMRAAIPKTSFHWGDLRVDGYVKGRHVISRTLSGLGVNQRFTMVADDSELIADGADGTRVVLRVTDEFGNPRPLSDEAVLLKLDGPADLFGDNSFSLICGPGAVWVRAQQEAAEVRRTATHPRVGAKNIMIALHRTPPERI